MIELKRVWGLVLRGLLVGLLGGLVGFAVLTLLAGSAGDGSAAAAATGIGAFASGGWPARWALLARLGAEFGAGYGGGGLLLGAVFALVFAAVDGRMGAAGPRATAAVLALAGLVVLDLVPALLSRPWPPGMLDDHQAALGAELRVALTLFSLAAAVVALAVRAQLPPWLPDMVAAGLALAIYAGTMGLVGLGLSSAVPAGAADLSAVALWRFRAATLGGHAALWIVLGLGFGLLVERALRPHAQALARRALA